MKRREFLKTASAAIALPLIGQDALSIRKDRAKTLGKIELYEVWTPQHGHLKVVKFDKEGRIANADEFMLNKDVNGNDYGKAWVRKEDQIPALKSHIYIYEGEKVGDTTEMPMWGVVLFNRWKWGPDNSRETYYASSSLDLKNPLQKRALFRIMEEGFHPRAWVPWPKKITGQRNYAREQREAKS